jgi:hypothetical protein
MKSEKHFVRARRNTDGNICFRDKKFGNILHRSTIIHFSELLTQ